MSNVVFCYYDSSKIRSWLSSELEKLIPNLDLHGLDRIVLDLAYKDLKLYLNFENKINISSVQTKTLQYIKEKTKELKAFLKFWSYLWVDKWKKRIAVSQKIPKISRKKVCKLRNARSIYFMSTSKKQLKKNVIKKLLKKGEICMPQQIADELIIREIADRINKKKLNAETDNMLGILHGVFTKIEKLQKDPKPIIYLKLTKKPLGYRLR
jgi:hypothetical protein